MSERILVIAAAIKLLEGNNPSNFLSDGTTPQIDVLEEATGLEDITAAERDEALNQVNDNPSPPVPSTDRDIVLKEEEKEQIEIIGKTMVRVKEGEEQLAWGSKFVATKVEIENADTGEDEEQLVLLGEFEKGGFEHVSMMEAVPRRGIIFRGTKL